jgi:hypothetical protein
VVVAGRLLLLIHRELEQTAAQALQIQTQTEIMELLILVAVVLRHPVKVVVEHLQAVLAAPVS